MHAFQISCPRNGKKKKKEKKTKKNKQTIRAINKIAETKSVLNACS